jgi:TP901-1 family phage major tail protein
MSGLRGLDFVVHINTGTTAAPVWTKVAGQRGGTLNRSMDPIDVSNKDDYGWSSALDGVRNWSIDFDCLVSETDAGVLALEDAFNNGDQIMVQMRTPGGHIYQGYGYVTEMTLEAPYDDVATFSGSITGDGALSKT